MDIIYKNCQLAHEKLKNKMIEIDNLLRNNDNKLLSEYYKYIKISKNITKYAYITIIFLSNKYLPGILVSGFYLKYIAKTKYNIVCYIQEDILTESELKSIKKIYDFVCMIPLLKLENIQFEMSFLKIKHYINLNYYITKIFCMFSKYHEKIIYFDSSTIISENIDDLFLKFKKSSYYKANKEVLHLTANFFLINCKSYFIEKALYLIENYNTLFYDKSLMYTPDENIIFYSVFPEWSSTFIDTNLFITTGPSALMPDIDYDFYNTSVNFNIIIKPFIFPLVLKNIHEPNMFSSNFYNFKIFDTGVIQLLKKFKSMKKYFKYIKTYRYTYV